MSKVKKVVRDMELDMELDTRGTNFNKSSKTLANADDTSFMSRMLRMAKKCLQFESAAKNMRLQITKKKTKLMEASKERRRARDTVLNITIEESNIEAVDEFVCLRTQINDATKEIKRPITLVKRSYFGLLKYLLNSASQEVLRSKFIRP